MILKILKYDIAINEENQKYVAKLIENQGIINFLYPNLAKSKSSSVSKCFKKNEETNENVEIDTNIENILSKVSL